MALIFVIEDEAILRANLVRMLQLKGCKIIEAKDGQDAIQKLQSSQPDLIICDRMMPIMDGMQVLNWVREQEKFNRIPFVFLTARAELPDQEFAIQSGAQSYITKPFVFSNLWEIIQSLLPNDIKMPE